MYTYEHGGSVRYERAGVIDFSANINPLGLPSGVKEAIEKSIESSVYYPDSFVKKLREELGDKEKLNAEYFFCGNGASDIIFRLCHLIKPKNALVLAPTFLDYERALSVSGCDEIAHYMLEKEKGFQPDESLVQIIKEKKYQMVWLCNPNNPTGCLLEKEYILEILKTCKSYGGYVVVDQCFLEFVQESDRYSVLEYIEEYQNLIVLKAFTKFYAMPGLRLGYGICSDETIISGLYYSGGDWSVSNVAEAAGIAALKDIGYAKNTYEYINREKEKLNKALQQLGYTVYASKANYLFFYAGEALRLDKVLLEVHNIKIRNCENYMGLGKGYYRIGIQSEEENSVLMEALKSIHIPLASSRG